MFKLFTGIVACYILIHSLPVFSQSFGTMQSANYYNAERDCSEYPAVSNIERKILGRSFQQEEIYSRLSRLELKVFGATFARDTLCDRLDKIKQATSRRTGYTANYPSRQQFTTFGGSDYSMQGTESYHNNGYGNNNYGAMTLWDVLAAFLTPYSGTNTSNYYNGMTPEFERTLDSYGRTNYGVGAHIIP